MFRTILRGLRWLLLIATVVGGYAGYRLIWGTPFTLTQLADRQAIFFLLDSPELLTSIGFVDGTFLDYHSGTLSDYGPAERDRLLAVAERNLAELRRFDRASLGLQDQITYDILEFQYSSALTDRNFAWTTSGGLYAISPMFGEQVGIINFMLQSHTIKNRLTAENYVKRVGLIAQRLDKVTAEAQRQFKLGVVLPVSLLDKSLTVIRDTVAPKPAEHPLVQVLAEKIGASGATDIDAALKAKLLADTASIVEAQVYPAYARMTAALESMRPASLTQSDGVDRLPGGKTYYAFALRQNTTTDYSADQIHQLGLDEVARITKEMDQILVARGLTQGTAAQRAKQLGEDPQHLYPNTDAGRAEMLAAYDRILKEVLAETPKYFATIPSTKLEVRRVPPTSEKGSAGAYYNPAAMDGSRPGVFYANLRDTTAMPKWGMKTLAYHEGIPGHHFQIAVAQNLKDLPFIRQQTLFTSYAEGWALYAELLAKEMGMYKDDPLGDLGRLQAEIFRAARLVVDTGIHAKGWSRQQAIDYMVGVTGMTVGDVTTEVERYMALPGQACAYKVGQLKILALREKARQALGERFNLKDFHRVILENGAVPLTVLERLVDEWIAQEKTRPAA